MPLKLSFRKELIEEIITFVIIYFIWFTFEMKELLKSLIINLQNEPKFYPPSIEGNYSLLYFFLSYFFFLKRYIFYNSLLFIFNISLKDMLI